MEVLDYIHRFRIVPNYFNMNIIKIRRKVLIEIIEKAEQDTSEFFKVTQDNLVAFVHFLLNHMKESQAINDHILSEHPHNINALCTKIIIDVKNGKFTEAESTMSVVEKVRDDNHLVTEAEAEVAFAYSKMGPEFNIAAITRYSKVVENEPENYEWKYRLALIRRRCQHTNVQVLLPTEIDPTENFRLCKAMFEDIIENCPNDTLKALSLVQIAALYSMRNWNDVNYDKLGIDVSNREKLIVNYLDQAMELDAEDFTVLQETGRILRSIKQFKAARKILEQAVSIATSDVVTHHLALTIQAIEGTTPLVVNYLEQASNNGMNSMATFDLGKAYVKLQVFDRAIKCFTKLTKDNEYTVKRQGFDNLAQCYKAMANQPDIYGSRKTDLYRKVNDMNKQCIIFGILAFLKNTNINDREKLTRQELFPSRMRKFYDFSSQRDQLIRPVNQCRGKNDFLRDIEGLIGSRIDKIQATINNYLQLKKHEDCLDMVAFLMVTDIAGIEAIGVETIIQIFTAVMDSGDIRLATKCYLYVIEYFYAVDESIGHVRIIHNEDSNLEAEKIKGWLMDLGLIVVMNDEDISSFYDRQTALVEALQGNIAVMVTVKGDNTEMLEGYPINMLTPNRPHLIPILADGNTEVPKSLRDKKGLSFSNSLNPHLKFTILKGILEIITSHTS